MSLNKAPKGTLGLALKFLMIILGSAVYAVGFQFFMYPNSITSGGIIGIAMIINELTKLPVGTMTIILNVPLFAIAWRHFGAGFMFSSFIGMALSSAFVDLFALFGIVATTDPMLGAIIGGTIKGAGLWDNLLRRRDYRRGRHRGKVHAAALRVHQLRDADTDP